MNMEDWTGYWKIEINMQISHINILIINAQTFFLF